MLKICRDKAGGGVFAADRGSGGGSNSGGFAGRRRQRRSVFGRGGSAIISALIIVIFLCSAVVFGNGADEVGESPGAVVPGGGSLVRIFKYAAVILVPLLVLLVSSVVLSRMVKRQVTSKMIKLEQEVAERMRAEAALRLSEQCFRAIADYTYFWEIWVGPDGQPLWTNPAVERVTGYTIKELMKMKDYPMPLVYEEDKSKVARAFKSALKGSTGKGFEFRMRCKDETVIWASMSWQPIYDEKGSSQGHRTSIHDITGRRRAEEALAHERDLLHILMENMPDTIYFKDTASRFTRISTAQAKLLGVSDPEEAVGKTDFDFFPRELADRYYADEQAIFQSGKALIDQEEPTIDSEGNRIWVSTTKVPLRDKEGNIVGLVGICRDITERKRTEDAMKLTQFSLDNSADAAFWMGQDARFVYVNNAACRSLGYSRRELLSMTVHDIDPDFPREAWPEHWEEVRRRGSFTLESHHRRKDGQVFPTEISVNYIKFGGKEYNCAFARDITERGRVEAMLRESEEQYRAVFEQAADSIVLIDAETGEMVRFNDKTYKGLGYTRDEFKKLKIPEFEVIESADEVAEHIEKIIREGGDTFETRHKTKSGEIRNILVSARAISIGGKDFVQAIWRDITERKQAEAAREQLTRELEEKNKELESILYVASHDLKSPLVNIQGFSNELSRNCDLIRLAFETKDLTADVEKKLRFALDESIPEALGFISSSANRMDSLLSGLLRLCRLGSEAMEIEPLDMNALLSSVAKNMEYQIKKAGVKVEIGQLPGCVGDAWQINQVFSNLLDNALKYLDDSRPGVIRIRAKVEEGQNIYCVQDNGVGIAPDHQNKIFEIFHQLEPEQKGGEGLGLTIVRRIIDRHNGRIWVESEPGKGSKFFVSLPSS